MNIEDRLRAHMQEQNERLQIESPGLSSLGSRSSRASLPVIAAAAAVLFVTLTGAGLFFWSSEEPEVSEIAAGTEEEEQEQETEEAEDAEQTEEPTDTTAVDDEVLETGALNVRRLSSPDIDSPDMVMVDGGRYYALSVTGGGPASPTTPPEAAEWEAAGYEPSWLTSRVLNVLDPETGEWSTSDFGDRYIATFSVEDGVVTAVSPGRLDGPDPAIGRSVDQGASWDWQPLEGLSPAESYSLVVTEQETLLFTVDFGEPDYNLAMRWAMESGVITSADSILNITPGILTYLPGTAEDECQRFVQYEARATLSSLLTVIDADTGDGNPALEAEFLSLAGALRGEAETLGCTWDSQWDTPDGLRAFNQAVTDGVIEVFEPNTVTWEDLGQTVPDEWFDVSALFRLDGSRLEPLDLPFDPASGYPAAEIDGSLQIPVVEVNDIGELVSETVWSTSDGRTWESRTVGVAELMVDPFAGFDFGGQQAPVVDGKVYRVEYLPTVESDATADGLGFETELQRRSEPDGAWETVDLAGVIPGLDLTDRIVDQVTGTSLGVFISVIEPVDGFPKTGVTVVHTADGVTWESFELDAGTVTFHSTDDSVLVVGVNWGITADDLPVFESFLLTSSE